MKRFAAILLALLLSLPALAQTTRPTIYLSMGGDLPADLRRLPIVYNMGQGALNDTVDEKGNLVKRENNSAPINFRAVEERLAKLPKNSLVLWNWEPNHAVDRQYQVLIDGKRRPYENDIALDHHLAALRGIVRARDAIKRPDLLISTSTAFPVWGGIPWRERSLWPEFRRLNNRVVKELVPLCGWMPLDGYWAMNSVPGVVSEQDHIKWWSDGLERRCDLFMCLPEKTELVGYLVTHYIDHNTGRADNPIPGHVFAAQLDTMATRTPVTKICVFGFWEKDETRNQWAPVLRQYLGK